MTDETDAATRAPELAEPMADMLSGPLTAAAHRIGREPLDGATDVEFFPGVATAFAGVFAVGMGATEGGSFHLSLIYHIMRRVSGSDDAAERFCQRVDQHMRAAERPVAFLEGFRVGERAGHQCYDADDPASGHSTLTAGYEWVLGTGPAAGG